MGGVVKGSVRMIKAKNNIAEERIAFWTVATKLLLNMADIKTMVNAVIRKLRTRSNRPILRTTSKPPSNTKGSIQLLPIHQLAERLMVKYVNVMAKTTGLNKCLPLMEIIYFEAIAQTATQPKSQRSLRDLIGESIRARIRAEI